MKPPEMNRTAPRGNAADRAKSEVSPGSYTSPLWPDKDGKSKVRIDFRAVNRAALANLVAILIRLLPDGKLLGREFLARNPRRTDRTPGSFKINILTARWADFATGDKGGDVVSLVAYIANVPQTKAARILADMLRIGGCRHG